MPQISPWKTFFAQWPKDLPHRGVLITVLNDQVPFRAFMISDDMILLERNNPDPIGARIVLVPFDQISTLKITDVVREPVFAASGFIGKLSGK